MNRAPTEVKISNRYFYFSNLQARKEPFRWEPARAAILDGLFFSIFLPLRWNSNLGTIDVEELGWLCSGLVRFAHQPTAQPTQLFYEKYLTNSKTAFNINVLSSYNLPAQINVRIVWIWRNMEKYRSVDGESPTS